MNVNSMDHFFYSIVFAGFIYVVTPGPVFLAIITIVSEQNRFAAAKLVSGSIFGCFVWLAFTSLSFIEADKLPSLIFFVLTLFCSFYLFWLAFLMFKKGKTIGESRVFKKPFKEGFFLGMLNPKSYPVMISVFSVVVYEQLGQMAWLDFPRFYSAACIGFFAGYSFMIVVAGFKSVTKLYNKNVHFFSYVFSAIYCAFGFNLLLNAIY